MTHNRVGGILAVLVVCAAVHPVVVAEDVGFSAQAVRESLPLLSAGTRPASEEYSRYLHYYGLDTISAGIRAGWFTSDSLTCVGQIFSPRDPHGTVFFQHGLFDHTGTIVNGVSFCVQQGFSVAALDLPGHGLSSGERAGINSFDEYMKAFSWFMALCGDEVDTPYVFIGHSTGCAIGYSYVSERVTQPFSRLVFLAPLARSAWYHLSVVGAVVVQPFTRSTVRWIRRQSHDDLFQKRLRADPFQARRLPVRWVKAYFSWWRDVRELPPKAQSLTIIQGTDDGVVDWKYNLSFYRRKVEDVRIVQIKGARHQLLNEAVRYRRPCIDAIAEVLEDVSSLHTAETRADTAHGQR